MLQHKATWFPAKSDIACARLPCLRYAHGRLPAVRTFAKEDAQQGEVGLGLKAVWFGAEAFGKLIGGKSASSASTSAPARKFTREECIEAIKADYAENYFVSGAGEMAAYAPDCTFSDPFVSFKGTDRFKQNVGNLGGLMKDIRLEVYEFNEKGSNEVETKWRFSCILTLPWKPRLAAAGSTTHVIRDGLCVEHIERWDVEPEKVVQQLFLPAAKVPSNAWETFLLAAADRDTAGMWFVLTPSVVKLSAPIIGVSLLCKLFTGEGLPGVWLGTVEGLAYLGFVSGVVTEVIKLAQGMQGGETGTGGRF